MLTFSPWCQIQKISLQIHCILQVQERVQNQRNSKKILPTWNKKSRLDNAMAASVSVGPFQGVFPEWLVGWKLLGRAALCKGQYRAHGPKSRCSVPWASALSWQIFSSYFPFVRSSVEMIALRVTYNKEITSLKQNVLSRLWKAHAHHLLSLAFCDQLYLECMWAYSGHLWWTSFNIALPVSLYPVTHRAITILQGMVFSLRSPLVSVGGLWYFGADGCSVRGHKSSVVILCNGCYHLTILFLRLFTEHSHKLDFSKG